MTKKTAKLDLNSPDEIFLERLNEILAPQQEKDYERLPETLPSLHIIGAPRSGTTLLSQLISAHLDVGYINNLIAAFWSAPVYGVRLSRKLLKRQALSSYSSDYGRTSGIHEPHEFGRFWFSNLGYREMDQSSVDDSQIDWERLATILNNISAAFEKPVVYKNFLIAWHMETILGYLPKTCFVRVKRDPEDNALSLLGFRKEYWNTYEKWVSMKPMEYSWLKDKHFTEQVVGQVYFLETYMTEKLEKIDDDNVLDVTYEHLCEDPRSVLNGIVDLLGNHGSSVSFLSEPPEGFEKTTEEYDHDITEPVHNYVNSYYGNDARFR